MSPSPWLATRLESPGAQASPRPPATGAIWVSLVACHRMDAHRPSQPRATKWHVFVAPPQNRTGIWSRLKGVLASVRALWVHERKVSVPEKGTEWGEEEAVASVSSGHLGRACGSREAQHSPSRVCHFCLPLGRGTAVPPPQQLLTCGVWPRYTSLPHRKFLCELCRGPHAPLWTQSSSQWKTTDYQMCLMT